MFRKRNLDRSNDSRKSEEGIVLILVAATLVVMLGFVALGVSTGYLFSARTDVQALADAAALGGAASFITNPFAVQPETAEAYARAVALNQGAVMQEALAASDVQVDVDIANRRVQVDIATDQPTFFARVLGINTAGVNARAYAEASGTASADSCAKPWFIPSTLLLDDDDDMCMACAGLDSDGPGGTPHDDVVGYTDGPLLVWDDGGTYEATGSVYDLVQRYADGTEGPYTMRPTGGNTGIAPGQFYAVALSGPGGNVYRDSIAACVEFPFRCFDTYPTEPGSMNGPTRQGVDLLTGDPPATINFHPDGALPPSITWDFTRDHGPGGITTSTTDRQLSIAPIWDACNAPDQNGFSYCETGDFSTGRHEISVVGFALIFIEGRSGSNVLGRVLDVSGCEDGGGAGGGTGMNPGPENGIFSRPLNLVRITQ